MDPVLKLDNDPIQFVKEAKFLGLIWDTKLTFVEILLKLYLPLVRSKLDYGCIVYGSAAKTSLAELDPVHNQGLRLSLRTFRSSPVESLYIEAHEPPFEIRRTKLVCYFCNISSNPAYNEVLWTPRQTSH